MEILVAKSYQGLAVAEAPYEKNKKLYCKVKMKNGSLKEVRVYSQKEYDKMYPEPAPKWKPQKTILGFGEAGYIWIFNKKPEFEEFYERGPMRYHRIFGWYLPSDMEMPELPEGVIPKQLPWSAVGGTNGELVEESQLLRAFVTFLRGK